MPRRLSLALLPLFTFPLFAQIPAKHPIGLDDIAKLQQVGRPVVSPDGNWIAYTVRHTDTETDKSVSNLWMVSWDGATDLQLTYDTEGAASPLWSPDGRYLAFLSSRPGPAKGSQVWVLDRRGGEAHQVTNVKEELSDYRWSPDSRQILLTLHTKDETEEPKNGKPAPPKPIVIDRYQFKQDVQGYLTNQHDHLYLFDIATSKLTKLINEEDGHEEHEAEWSPNGRQIAFTSRQQGPDPFRTANSDVFVVNAVPGSTPRKLTSFEGPDSGPLAWSPDSKLIAYRQATFAGYSIYNQNNLSVVAATGGAPQLLAPALDRPVGDPFFTLDGSALLTSVVDDRNVYVERIPLKGAPVRVTEGVGVVNVLDEHAGHSVVVWTTDTDIPELYKVGADGVLRKLTHHNDALLATLVLSPSKDITAKTKDGNEVHGLLTMPPSYKVDNHDKIPMLLYIHGGPDSQDAHNFDLSRQLFAAHGYAVLNVNYRGSNGRGYQYSHTINADWGNKEVTDLLAAVDATVATGTIDPDKLAIGGWSYGGILTDYTIATTTRFKAASSGAGMGNLLGLYGVDEYILQYDNELGPPWKNPELYIKLSYPFFHADRIKTPTLFMGGDRDFNVPVEGGEQMYEALRSTGTLAELILYPGQFHGFTRPSFLRDRYDRWFNWYDKFLGLTPATAPASSVHTPK